MYLHITSSCSKELFRNNSPTSFTFKLPRRISIDGMRGSIPPPCRWEIALLDLHTPEFREGYSFTRLTLFCTSCDVSIYENDLSPVLYPVYRPRGIKGRSAGVSEVPPHPRYVPLIGDCLEYLELYILDEEGRPPSFSNGELTCTLHVRVKSSRET